MIKIFHKWFRSCLNLVYPLKCFVCDSVLSIEEPVKQHICPDCFKKIKFITCSVCEKCGRPSNSSICLQCNKNPKIFFDRVIPIAVYEDVLRELIHLFKYKKSDYLDKFLAGFLIEKILESDDLKDVDFIVPVPMHWFDKFRRGYNQTELLACEISKSIGAPVLSDRLIKYKRTVSQTTLSGKERVKNVKGAFKVKNSEILEGKKVLLIDDVFTTGATLNECSKMLRGAKVKHINALTLACVCQV